MCGINGCFAYAGDTPVDPAALAAVRDAMAVRGPDAAAAWVSDDGRVGLGHRRLAIIDLSPGGHQPMHAGPLSIVFNGEIYNYLELKRDLEARGHVFRSTSDTEVILALYAEKGAALVHDLRGMFAFGLWDAAKGGLLLARDPYGIKPLYLADDGRTLKFASQVRALLAGGGIDTRPEPAGHVGFFLWGHVPEPYTLYKGIRALPAGSTLWIDAQGRSANTFWRMPEVLLSGTTTPDLAAALADSVRHHLIADVPVGVFLSAGLDSTTLLAHAAAEGQQVRTLTLGFEEYRGDPRDEVPLAEAVAKHYDARHETHWVTKADFQADLPRLLAAMDQPTIDGVNTYFVSKAAAAAGLKVTLSGLGGDELFAGYPDFREIPRMASLLAPFKPLGGLFRAVATPLMAGRGSPKYAGLLEYGGSYAGAYMLRRGLFMPWELQTVLDPELARAGWQELEPLARLEASLGGLKNPRLAVTALESQWYMRGQLLRDSDWAGMAHSLEIRVPLVDAALLGQIAPLLRGPNPPSKRDMALTPARPLPAHLLDRPKSGFNVPVQSWLLEADGAAPAERGLRGWARHVYRHLAATP